MYLVNQFFGLLNMAYKERRRIVQVKRSKLILRILQLFYEEGLIRGYSLAADLKTIFVFLKYYQEKRLIQGFKVFSHSGKNIYTSSFLLSKFVVSNGLFVLSTSKYGLIFSNKLLRKNIKFLNKAGGQLLFQIYI
jgi:ribosomal protein S8